MENDFETRTKAYSTERMALLTKYGIHERIILSHITGHNSYLIRFLIWLLQKLQVKNAAMYVDISTKK